MGLSPDSWGPSFWSTIHLLCIGAPKEIPTVMQLQYIAFFQALPYILPCGSCSQHLFENYKKLPIEQYVDTQEKLFRWSVALHNEVNQSLKKPIWTEEQAREHWEKKVNIIKSSDDSTKNNSPNNKRMIITTIVISIIVIIGIYTLIRTYLRKNKK